MVTSQSQPKPLRAQFAAFEVDFANRELLKHGTRIRLQKQPFEILCMLLERPDEVVSRDELRNRVWPDNTFVEYEDSLNTAVRKLRAALSDSSGQPRYVATVARRGYRFIAPVVYPEVAQPSTHMDTPEDAPADKISQIPTETQRTSLLGSRWLYASIGALLVAAIVVWAWQSRSSVPRADGGGKVMLAVLPFQNLTPDPGQEYFSDGMTEEMIAELGALDPQHLGVIARTSVMHYKNSQAPLDQIERELGVQYILEGSVRRDTNQIRVTAQLIHAKDQTHIWTRQYDREPRGILSLQGEVAHEIVDEIQLTLGQPRLAASAPAAPAKNYEAYDLYLKGQFFLNKRNVSDLDIAVKFFQEAITKDPNDARAYAGLADACALIPAYSSRSAPEWMSKARAAALKALEIDNGLPEAHAALALIVQNYDWDWVTAEKEFRQAIELNPNYATAHHWYAEHLMWRGRFDEALQESERARQLDPLSLIIAADNGAILYFARQHDRAIEKWRSVLQMDPRFPRAYMVLRAEVEKGMYSAARSDLESVRSAMPTAWYLSCLAFVQGRAGQHMQAQQTIDQLLQLSQREFVDPMVMVQAYSGMADMEHTLLWVERAFAQHSVELAGLKVDPVFDPVRSEPRFQEIVRKVGLSE